MIAGPDASGREESPDTDLRQQEKWATRLVTPGELFAGGHLQVATATVHGKCHRKQTAAKESCCDGRQGNLLIVCEKRFCR